MSTKHGGLTIKKVGMLQPLRGTLEISKLENADDVKDASWANLKGKHVMDLLLRWDGSADNSQKEREALDALQPCRTLKVLEIECYRGTRFSDWVGNNSFSNLILINLWDCKNCFFLPPLGKLPSLENLRISKFDSAVTIGDELCCNAPSFRSLKSLDISNMPECKEWSFSNEAANEGGIFPSQGTSYVWLSKAKGGHAWFSSILHDLDICDCGQMEVLLPSQQFDKAFPCLNYMKISLCPKLESLLKWGSHSILKVLHLLDSKSSLKIGCTESANGLLSCIIQYPPSGRRFIS